MKTNYIFKGLVMLSLFSILFSSCKEEQKRKAPPTKVTVVNSIQKDMPIYSDFIGQTYGLYDIPIRARVQGFLEGRHFHEGTRIKKGDHLYSIDPQSYKANLAARSSDIAQAKTRMVNAESELKRYEPLAEANAVSQSDLDNAQAHYDASKAEVAAAEANYEMAEIELSYTEIYSPIDGIIGKTKAKVGEFVGQDPNPVILNTVSDVSSVNVEFFLTESDYLTFHKRFIKSDRNAADNNAEKVQLDLILADESIFDQKGEIIFIDREINPSTGSLLVQARFPNPDNLIRPGQYAKVRAQINLIEDAIVVPQACLMELQGQFAVYIVGDSNKIQRIQVEVGHKVDDYWIIEKGLKANEKVVLDGLQKVRKGVIVDPELVEYKSKVTKK